MGKKISLGGSGGRAWPAACRAGRSRAAWKSFCWRRKEAPRTWVAKEGVADMETLEVFNKLVTRRTPADLHRTPYCSKQKNLSLG